MTATGEQQVGILEGTKQQILDVARHLFSDRSYLGVSMSDIAARLGITKAALYYHFAGKKDIYMNVLDGVLSDLRARLGVVHEEEALDDRLRRMVRDYLDFGTCEKNLVNVLVVELSPAETELRQFITSSREDLVDLFQPVIERVLGYGTPQDDIDARLVATMLTAMMDGMILEHSFLERPLSPERVSGQIVALLGLRAKPSPC
ncbi:MAG: TetR/AcrR family transcriptional regulator [Coriobacteriia bacterium]